MGKKEIIGNCKKPPTNVKHMANVGDIICSLPALKRYYEITGKKINFLQSINIEADYYSGATHPTLSDDGKMVMCNRKMFDMVKPLLESQEYINSMDVYNGQPINIDLDVIRKERFVNMPHQMISQWLFIAYPDMACDLSKSWVSIGDVDMTDCFLFYPDLVTKPVHISEINLRDFAIINFTERYRNHIIDYFFLKKYQDRIIFAGTEKEYLLFTKKWQLNIPRLVEKNFLQTAFVLKNTKFMMGNQSANWNLSNAMKTPNILELCEFAPNCQAFIGEDSYGFYHQTAVKYYFELLMKKK